MHMTTLLTMRVFRWIETENTSLTPAGKNYGAHFRQRLHSMVAVEVMAVFWYVLWCSGSPTAIMVAAKNDVFPSLDSCVRDWPLPKSWRMFVGNAMLLVKQGSFCWTLLYDACIEFSQLNNLRRNFCFIFVFASNTLCHKSCQWTGF